MAVNQVFYLIGVLIQFVFGMGFIYLAWFLWNAPNLGNWGGGNAGAGKGSTRAGRANLGAGGGNFWKSFSQCALIALFLIGVVLIGFGIWKLFHIPVAQLPG